MYATPQWLNEKVYNLHQKGETRQAINIAKRFFSFKRWNVTNQQAIDFVVYMRIV